MPRRRRPLPPPGTATPAPAASPFPAQTPIAKRFPGIKYVAPKIAATGTRVDGDGGSRGGGVKMPSLYVLAPNHTGLTTHGQPSLFWYQSGPAGTRFELTVIEPKNPKPVLRVGVDRADQAGVHRLLLSKYHVTLNPGIMYKWTISLVPDPANRSQDVMASGTIQRTEPDAEFTAAVAGSEGLDQAALYASKGFWYDALEVVTNEIDAAPKDKALRLQRAGLLEQAGLKDAAASERK
ncbi:MAG: DUF928 domain-containing protein [Chthoniobacter sp.]